MTKKQTEEKKRRRKKKEEKGIHTGSIVRPSTELSLLQHLRKDNQAILPLQVLIPSLLDCMCSDKQVDLEEL